MQEKRRAERCWEIFCKERDFRFQSVFLPQDASLKEKEIEERGKNKVPGEKELKRLDKNSPEV